MDGLISALASSFNGEESSSMEGLTSSLATPHIDGKAPTDSLTHDQSSNQLPFPYTRTPVAGDQDSKGWVHFPPDATLDEQLLILGGGSTLLGPATRAPQSQPSTVSQSVSLPPSTAIIQPRSPASLFRRRRPDSHTTDPSGTSSSSYSRIERGHLPETYIAHYTAILSHNVSPHALATAPLPHNMSTLEVVSGHMADQMYLRYRAGLPPVLPPRGHPEWPFWVREHEGNASVSDLLEREAVEQREREGVGGEKGKGEEKREW